ncbi:MAG: hypothetical protein PHV37_08600 [Candidatus Gastranaerophilales bacterium]|nr:hypothetical protein [Candidatus Gastranaerophilales bacterium]
MNNVRELILGAIVLLLLVIFGIKQVSGIIGDFRNDLSAKNEKVTSITDLTTQVKSIEEANTKMSKQQEALRPFFKQSSAPDDSIASFGGMFEDIVDFIKVDGLLLRSIEYVINPEQDLIYKNFSNTHNVCEIRISLIGTYSQIQNFFKDVYMYPYFVNVSNITIIPYEANKKYLVARVSINLYSVKNNPTKAKAQGATPTDGAANPTPAGMPADGVQPPNMPGSPAEPMSGETH